MKKNRLYTANRWNQPAFMVDRKHHNIYDGWQDSYLEKAIQDRSTNPWNYADDVDLVSQYAQQSKNGLGLSKANNPFSRMNIGSTAGNIVGAVGGVVNQLGNRFISNGYNAGGVGDGIANIGSTVGSAISTVNPLVGGIVSAASGVLGGLTNRTLGTKKNQANISAIEQNTDLAKSTGNVLAGVSDNNSLMDAAGQMTGSSGFGTTDLVKGGWAAKGKAKRMGQKYINAENAALAYQNQGLLTGATNADNNLDNTVMGNFAAYGGPIDINGMSAIDYSFMSDYLTLKKKETETKNRRSGTIPTNIFGNGGYGGGGVTSRWDPEARATFKGVSDFNEAFDKAVANNMYTFWFNGLEYNTKKEHNPVREINNRIVGGMRKPHTSEDKNYVHVPYPIRDPLNAFPMVSETFQADLVPVPTLELSESPIEEMHNMYIPQSIGRSLIHPTYMPRDKAVKAGEDLSRGFALGGDLQTNGADFSDGLVTIGAGGSHETNPNEGIQMGIDNENVPNLVEEGETIYDQYVFSNRILADEATKQMFRLPKKKEITFADISKRLEKEIAERSNDPISKAGFEKQMQMLEEQQERQKQEMEAERARAAFEALSPEEQTALMQQRAEQEAMIEQQAAMQQPTPEEIDMVQQQMQQADGSEAVLGQEPQMNCFGGKINRFDLGGNILKSLGIHTLSDFKKWAKNNKAASDGFDWDVYQSMDDVPWDDLIKSPTFQAALSKDNPALADALQKGYDFGTYIPTGNGRATIQSISKGNWKTTTGKGWRGSEDLAFKQATEGLSDAEIDALTTEQLAERMRNTPAYQNTNKWLQNSDNALQYLNTLLNDPDTPEVAREYARKFVKDGKWKDGFNYDYATVFGSNGKGVRETNPGTYWHTALEANRGNQTGNFVINEDGTIEPILGDVPVDWTPSGNYAWSDVDNDYTYNYYTRPGYVPATNTTVREGEASKSPIGTDTGNSEQLKNTKVPPRHRAGWLRYAGLFGPAVGLGMQALGVGRPDTASLDAAISRSGDVNLADYQPIGNYLTYRPLDIWYQQNALNAQARATDRALLNNSSPSRMSGLLANGYNSQLASGNLFRQAQEYNDNLRKQVEEFNRGTNQFNAEAYNRTSQFNADAKNRARQYNAQLRLQAAREKMDADAGWYNGLYGNVAGLFKGLGDIGRENEQFNWLSDLAADGAFGNLGTSNTSRRWTKEQKAKGGKIKKRGLTI